MHFAVETTQGLERRLTITLPAQRVEFAVESELQHMAKRLSLNGFRKGKVPLAVARSHYGGSARQQVIQELMQHHFEEALESNNFRLAGRGQFYPSHDESGKDFVYQVLFEIFPAVNLTKLDTLVIEKPVLFISEEQVDKAFQSLHRHRAIWSTVERSATKDDRVNINFVGSHEGQTFEGGSSDDFTVNLEENQLVDGFASSLIGHQSGDQFVIDITFPDDYHHSDLAGKSVQFQIYVNRVEAYTLPELTTELLNELGSSDGTLDGLKLAIRQRMTRRAQRLVDGLVKQKVADILLESHERIDLPNILVQEEVARLIQSAEGQVHPDGDSSQDLYLKEAQRRVTLGLLMSEVVQQEQLKVDHKLVDAILESIASSHKRPAEVIQYYRSNDELMSGVRHLALESQAVEAILTVAKVVEKELTLEELLQQSAGDDTSEW